MNLFAKLLRVRGHTIWIDSLGPDTVVIDAGAHRGEFSTEIHENFGCATILIEANPDLASVLVPPASGQVVHAALSSEDGHASFYFSGNPEAGGIAGDTSTRSADHCTVETIMLASALRRTGHSRANLLKLDIEGSEFEVIASASDSVLREISQLTVEFHDFLPDFSAPNLFTDACKRLENLGFVTLPMTIRGHGDVLFLNTRQITISRMERKALQLLGRWIIKYREWRN